MRYRVLKFLTTSMSLLFIWLVIHLFVGGLDLPFATGCLVVSGFWLIYTYFRLGRLFQTYVSMVSRAQVLVPLCTGLLLDVLALAHIGGRPVGVISIGEVPGWLLVYVHYRRCAAKYNRVGHGPLPKESWIDPTDLRPGDLILTSGMMADVAHDAVGHGETVLRGPDDKLYCFSSYMRYGAVINAVERVVKGTTKKGFYIVMRPVVPFTDEENDRAYQIALGMREENNKWRNEANARRQRIVDALPLPRAWKAWLFKKVQADGYDWRGLILGWRRKHAWTCIGACLELYKRLGRKTRQYGTGLFGLGTGLLDPIVPVRFVYDPNFHLLDLNDKAAAGA